MKQCPVCGRPIESRRKDAVYCKNSACRKKAHQARKEQAATAPLSASAQKASVVVAFPDGSRWLLELSPLQATAATTLPTLTQVATATTQNRSGSVPPAPTEPAAPADEPPPPDPAAENRSEPIPNAGVTSIPTVTPPSTIPAEPPSGRDAEPPAHPLRTLELFFTDAYGRRLPFRQAMRRRLGSGWAPLPGVMVRLGRGASDGYGLGGVPGRWREYYPNRSPTEFGLDADLAVLYDDGDERGRRVSAADSDLVCECLGRDWRSTLRDFSNGDRRP